ncbi:MAG: MOSC domain-containing protein [Actinomycetota bacterium]
MPGRVHQINVSPGGVPKLPVPEAHFGVDGVEGDRQADTVHHGGPDQTVCVYSLEVIEALQAEGHRVHAGATGENLTVSGLDWSAVRPGARLEVGPALLEITYPTSPCHKNARWFMDGRFSRMHDGRHPGWSRMYARVLTEGRVRTGDPVQLVPMEERK